MTSRDQMLQALDMHRADVLQADSDYSYALQNARSMMQRRKAKKTYRKELKRIMESLSQIECDIHGMNLSEMKGNNND